MAKIKTTNILIVSLIAITIFIIVGYISIQQKEKATIAEAIDAIPINASYIFEINNLISFSQNLKSDNAIWQQLINFNQLSEFKNQVAGLDSIIAKSETIQSLLKKRKVLISSHSIGSSQTVFLFTIKLSKKKEHKELVKEFFKLSNTNDSVAVSRIYNGVNLYSLVGNNSSFYFSIIDNILIFSKSELIIENAIRQKSSNDPISLDLGFKEIAEIVSKNSNHIFFNYSNFGQSYARYFSTVFSKKVKKLQNFANWAALDISFKQNSISLSGYSYVAQSPDKYLHIFENSAPQKFDLENILPIKTAEFTFLGFNNIAKFYSNYEKFIHSKNLANNYKTLTDEFNSNFEVDIQTSVLQLIGNSITFANINFNNSIKDYAHFTIIKTNNKEEFKIFLDKITQKYIADNNIDKKFSTNFEIDNNTSHTIYKLPVDNFVQILFGELGYLVGQKYYFFYEDYIIFSSSAENAKLYINALYRKNTLAYNEDFQNFIKQIPSKSNILYYTNSNFNSFSQLSSINEKYADTYKSNINFFNKIQHLCIQFSYEKTNFFQTHINILYNKDLSSKGLSAWETELKNNITTKPLFFKNHYTYEREIFVQDKDNIIYLLDKNGLILWKKQLKEQIVGDIFMVDLYNNSKFQIIFATSKYIIAIDRNGKILENYPVKLPKPTKRGLSIADYDGKKDYRLFIPGIDNTVYLFDKEGKEVEGWIKPKTETEIISNIKYFTSDGKDYIVFADKTKPYIVNRKGEERVTANQNVPMPDNANFYFQKAINNQKAKFITTDASGKIINIYLNGKTETQSLISVSKNHSFKATDLNNDGLLDYILTDDKTIFAYNSNGDKIFSYTFKNKIGNIPIIFTFSQNNKKIGLVIPIDNKVFILNSDGSIANNFPVEGNSVFSVGVLNENNNFNLIVGNNNFLCNYLVF